LAIEGLSARLVLVALIAAALGLASCGRNGPLGLPPSAAAAQPVAAAPPPAAPPGSPDAAAAAALESSQKNGFDAQGNPVAAAGQKKSFILDPLLQ
jgi:predicted small lipoprotein YifL